MASDAEHSFICIPASVCLPWRSVCSSFHFLIGMFVFLEWSHISSLYILEMKPSSFANIFAFTVGSLFILLIFVFSCAEAFYFDDIVFVYSFLYVPYSRGHISENIAAWNIWDFPAYVSSRTSMVSWLIFRSFIHLELIFVCGVSWCSSFIILHVAVQVSQHHLLNRLLLLHFMLLPP